MNTATTTKGGNDNVNPEQNVADCSPPARSVGQRRRLYENEAMRLLVLASFSALIGLAVPAHADAGPLAGCAAGLTRRLLESDQTDNHLN
jgi:hypothetical protein